VKLVGLLIFGPLLREDNLCQPTQSKNVKKAGSEQASKRKEIRTWYAPESRVYRPKRWRRKFNCGITDRSQNGTAIFRTRNAEIADSQSFTACYKVYSKLIIASDPILILQICKACATRPQTANHRAPYLACLFQSPVTRAVLFWKDLHMLTAPKKSSFAYFRGSRHLGSS